MIHRVFVATVACLLTVVTANAAATQIDHPAGAVAVHSEAAVSAPPIPVSQPQKSTAATRFVPGLEEPLVATGPTSRTQDRDLDLAIAQFASRGGPELDFPQIAEPFLEFLQRHPQSPWRSAILTNLGIGYYHSGYFSRAFAAWDQAWQAGREAADSKAKWVVDRAVGELARMQARVGHADELQRLLADIGNRPVSGPATEMLTGAREGLWMFRNEPGQSYLCGPQALKNLLISLKASPRSIDLANKAQSGPNGFTLEQVAALATQAGLSYDLIHRTADEPIPVPSVINWKVHHYAAIVGVENGRYHIQDPTFASGDLWISKAAIDAESTGYFLVPRTKELQVSAWRLIPADEARQVYGMGFTAVSQPGSETDDDKKLDDSPPPATPTEKMCKTGAMCAADAHLMQVSLNLNDTPVGYRPQKGLPVFIRMTYNQREASQPANFSFFNISPKWTLNVLSYIQDDPNGAGRSVSRYAAGGGDIDYSSTYTYNTTTGAFSPERQGQAVLVRIPATGPVTSYELRLPDGSKQVFAQSDGASTSPRRIFLTALVDAAGNALNFNYDNQLRLASVTDATGRNTIFAYGMASNPLLVTQITDPFGRRANLAYDSQGRLSSITDVIGMTSSFSYDSSGLINAMTTPYGTTTFAYGQGANNSRFLEMTDPLGFTERLEFAHLAPGVPYADSVAPTSIGAQNVYLYYRNTFHWGKHLYPIAHSDYTRAEITHWLHSPIGQTSPIVESTKQPLENRVWNVYPGQSSTIFEGTAGTPLATARVLDDGTTQAKKFTYNNLGKPTSFTDPVGRQSLLEYDANNIDLLRVKQQTSPSMTSTIATYTYNTQHLPLTATDASGGTTTYTYTAAGQLASITDALGQVTHYAYDSVGRLVSITNPSGVVQRGLTYDAFDRIQTQTDSEGRIQTFSYDALDRLTQIKYPDGTSTQLTYDKQDLSSVTDRLGRKTSYGHDANKQLVSTTDALGQVTRYSYYEDGTLKSLTDPKGNVTTWDIDIQSRPTARHSPDGKTEVYSYENTTSRLKSTRDALGQVRTYSYFADSKQKGISYTGAVNATSNVSFTYDAYFPRLTSMTDGIGTTAYTYTPVGEPGALSLATEDGPYTSNDTIAYAYDVLGRVQTRTVDATPESFSYDPLSRVAQHVTALGTFTYAYLGQTRQVSRQALASTMIATTYGYDSNTNDRRLLSIANSGAARSFSITSTPEDQISGVTETPGSGAVAVARGWSMQYDNIDRLVSATVSEAGGTGSGGGSGGGHCCQLHDHHHEHEREHRHVRGHGYFCEALEDHWKQSRYGWRSDDDLFDRDDHDHDHNHNHNRCKVGSGGGGTTTQTDTYKYAYDTADNVTSFTSPSATNQAAYNNLNQLTTYGSQAYAYDANGNLLSDAVRNYKWDAGDRLVEISLVADPLTVTRIRYDGLGRRLSIAETSGGATTETRFLWCGDEICQARTSANVVTRRYFTEGESHVDTGTKLVYMRDQLGSVRDTVNAATGVLVGTFDYDPYGELTTTTAPADAPDRLFAQMFYASNLGLYLTRYRAYDSSIGRWISRDPIKEAGGVNLYAYVNDNPTSDIDPSGLLTADEAFRHYREGSGSPLRMSFDDIDTKSVQPSQFTKVKQILDSSKHGDCCQEQHTTIDDRLAYTTLGETYWLLGNITLRLQGSLDVSMSCDWSFSGTLKSFDDIYDFNSANYRSWFAEWLTTFGRHTKGKSFDIQIRGSKDLEQSGHL